MGLAERLLTLKGEIEEKKQEAARKDGQIKELRSRLKDEFGVKTPKEAAELAEKLQKEIHRDEELLAEEIEKLEEGLAGIGG